MSVNHDRSTRSYEREADETRRRLSSSLDELATSLTPGRMLDEVLSYARAGGADFLRGLGNAASANPMPTLLIGLGAAMFLTGKGRIDGGAGNGTNGHGASVLRHAADAMRRRTGTGHPGADFGDMAASARHGTGLAASSVGTAASNAAGAVRSAASSAVGAVGSAASSAANAVGSTASRTAGQVRSGVAAVGSAAGDAGGAIRDTATAGLAAAGDLASSAGSFVSGAAGTMADSARAVADSAGQLAGAARDVAAEEGQRVFDQTARLTHDLTERTNRLIHDQPLAVAGAGFAIGATLAAMLPRTRMEDALLGETSDAVKDTVAGAATEQFQRAKEATGRVVEEAKNAAEREGLSTSAAADAVRDMGEKIKHVVTAAGEAAKTESGELATEGR